MNQKNELLEFLSLWASKDKNGNTYYTGSLGNSKVVAFQNTNKKNEKEPDLRIYLTKREPLKKEEDTLPF